ncbi:S8 family serine peptidase [Aquipuribacter sp. MA13-6]|uniref:S8 family serine peptidase n=1 Tax=Aquipuribacter sp. MA13-6 TaxID=3440839 RepID=UPI003EEC45D7
MVSALTGAVLVVTLTGPAGATVPVAPPVDERVTAAVADLPDDGEVRVVSVELDDDRPVVTVETAADPSAAEDLLVQRAADDDVVSLGLDSVVRTADHAVSTDPLRVEQWGMGTLRAEHVWSSSRGDGTVVAVIDSGVDGTHPDLTGRVLPGADWVEAGGDGWADRDGHGTHVAGVVAAVPGNGIGVVGLAPGSQVLPLRVLDENGEGYSSDVADAVVEAALYGVDVINLSLSSDYDDPWVAEAVEYALGEGVVVVAAAGNAGDVGNPVQYPAATAGVIAVAASDIDDRVPSWSSRHPYVAVAAPGDEIVSTVLDGGYDWYSGTSMATPHVAATAALLRSASPTASVASIRRALTCTAVDIEAAGTDTRSGHGRIAPVAALLAVDGACPVPPAPPAPAPTRLPGLPRDLSGDGRADVLGVDGAGRLWLYPGTGTGFSSRRQVGVGFGARDLLVQVGDFDGDRRGDLIARNPADGSLWLYRGNGRGGWLGSVRIGQGWGGFDALLSPSDFNGDGTNDLLARRTDGTMWLYPGNGRGGFLRASQVGQGWGQVDLVSVAGDFDTDRRPDVIARGADGRLWLYRGNGQGRFLSGRVQVGSGWATMASLLGPGDFDGDGRPDLLAVTSTGTLRLYPSTGNGGFRGSRQIGVGWSTMRLAR